MNKKLLMAAVSSALVAGPILAAQASTTVYGRFNVGIASVDNGNTANNKTLAVTDDASRLGVKGSEDLGGGLKGIYTIEFELDGDGRNGVTPNARDVFVGLQGSWGTLRVGQFNTAFKNVSTGIEILGDTIADFTISGVSGESRLPNLIEYRSPSFNGLTFEVGSSRGETGTDGGTAEESNPMLFAVKYQAGPLYIGFGHVDNDIPGALTTGFEDSTKVAFEYKFNAFSLFGMHTKDNNKASGADAKTVHLGGAYKMGNNTFALTWTKYDRDTTNGDGDMIGLGVIHALSKNTAIKGVYAKMKNDSSATFNFRGAGIDGLAAPSQGNDPKALQLQIMHSF